MSVMSSNILFLQLQKPKEQQQTTLVACLEDQDHLLAYVEHDEPAPTLLEGAEDAVGQEAHRIP